MSKIPEKIKTELEKWEKAATNVVNKAKKTHDILFQRQKSAVTRGFNIGLQIQEKWPEDQDAGDILGRLGGHRPHDPPILVGDDQQGRMVRFPDRTWQSLIKNNRNFEKVALSILFIVILTSFSLPTTIASAEPDVERVIIVSVDSMNNIFVFNEYDNPGYKVTPNIGILVENGAAFTKAEAVMPTKTQVNHVTIVSGSYADNIGIVGNYVFDTSKKRALFFQTYDFPWKNPSLIKADTIFKAMERENPDYTSAVVAGKNYVGTPIWADYQAGPAYTSKTAKELGIKKFPEIVLWDSPDEWVMDNALLVLEEVDPDIMLIHLPFLDPVQHSFGHGSMESWATLAWADYQIGRLEISE